MKGPSQIKMASRVKTATKDSKVSNRTMVRGNSRMAVSRAANRAIKKAQTRMVTTRMARTNSNRARLRMATKDSKGHHLTNSRASN